MSILVAMSGGVDSSVSAFLMREKHGVCVGATMLLADDGGNNINDARSVCEALGIGHEVIDLRGMFRDEVIRRFVEVYESGGTPNPCIDCNRFMKFGEFVGHARAAGHDMIATGHYARIERDSSGRWLLRKAADTSRDQSYVLYMMTQDVLAHTEFPLGGMLKSDVRDMAASLGFTNARKHDSQDICFVPDGDYAGFIESYTGKVYPPGDFVDTNGNILGTHRGIIHYTAGQRRGLGVAAKSRLYVSRIDPAMNTVTLAPETDAGLLARGVVVRDVNLVACETLPGNFRAGVKVRYRQREIPCVANQAGPGEIVIEFTEAVRSPAVGQAAVMYDGEYVIGGGTVSGVMG
ncbi:MAG: tRNA 2-thiouridine(34) synthase MnmA [Synergistaceae bacterium]|nr:tRNA 2-thiouridine(34) synthase MnmA [Synergistaceae bacterium]